MARHNTAKPARARTPILTEKVASGRTHEGAPGYKRDAKSELFLGAVSNLNEDTFYESAEARADRLRPLIEAVALADPEWVEGFVRWLRTRANLRSVAVLVAAEAAKARVDAGASGHTRAIVRASMRRADEPGEFLGYWQARFGRKLPIAVKRGIGDGARDLFSERSWLKYKGRGEKGNFSLADVLNLTHPKAKDQRQSQLFSHVIAQAYGHDDAPGEALAMLRAREDFAGLSLEEQKARIADPESAAALSKAGLTHEALAGFVGKLDADAWKALVPTMGYTALRMNLRRMVEAGIDPSTVETVSKRLADPEEVARSRQLPMDFLSAYRNAPMQFHWPLEQAMNHSLARVPALPGRTLVMVDRSASMGHRLSERGTLSRADAAAIFGSALALRGEDVTLVEYASDSQAVSFRKSDSVLGLSNRFVLGGGTRTRAAVQKHFAGHDRVINLTDEQRSGSFHTDWENLPDPYVDIVPEKTPVFTWNLAGYEYGEVATGKHRHTFGGLTDAGFELIEPIESGFVAGWPWEA